MDQSTIKAPSMTRTTSLEFNFKLNDFVVVDGQGRNLVESTKIDKPLPMPVVVNEYDPFTDKKTKINEHDSFSDKKTEIDEKPLPHLPPTVKVPIRFKLLSKLPAQHYRGPKGMRPSSSATRLVPNGAPVKNDSKESKKKPWTRPKTIHGIALNKPALITHQVTVLLPLQTESFLLFHTPPDNEPFTSIEYRNAMNSKILGFIESLPEAEESHKEAYLDLKPCLSKIVEMERLARVLEVSRVGVNTMMIENKMPPREAEHLMREVREMTNRLRKWRAEWNKFSALGTGRQSFELGKKK